MWFKSEDQLNEGAVQHVFGNVIGRAHDVSYLKHVATTDIPAQQRPQQHRYQSRK